MYLVGSERCGVLWAAAIESDYQCWTLLTTINQFEPKIERKTCIQNMRKDITRLFSSMIMPHVAKRVKKTLEALDWDVLPYLPYSPDITPSDYHLFRSMQSGLSGERFRSYGDIKNWFDEWITPKPNFFYHGIRSLPEK